MNSETTYYKANCHSCGESMQFVVLQLGKIMPCPACGIRHWLESIKGDGSAEVHTRWPSWVDEQQEIFHKQRDDEKECTSKKLK